MDNNNLTSSATGAGGDGNVEAAADHADAHQEQASATKTPAVSSSSNSIVQRFPVWMALMVFSTICVVALEEEWHGESFFDADETLVVTAFSVSLASLILSFIVMVSYLVIPAAIIGKIWEIIVIFLLLAIWSAGAYISLLLQQLFWFTKD